MTDRSTFGMLDTVHQCAGIRKPERTINPATPRNPKSRQKRLIEVRGRHAAKHQWLMNLCEIMGYIQKQPYAYWSLGVTDVCSPWRNTAFGIRFDIYDYSFPENIAGILVCRQRSCRHN